jgi:hypothetical protein
MCFCLVVVDIRGGDIKKDKLLIQYARKPGLAHNQRWKYKDGFIFPQAAPHLVIDIRVSRTASDCIHSGTHVTLLNRAATLRKPTDSF